MKKWKKNSDLWSLRRRSEPVLGCLQLLRWSLQMTCHWLHSKSIGWWLKWTSRSGRSLTHSKSCNSLKLVQERACQLSRQLDITVVQYQLHLLFLKASFGLICHRDLHIYSIHRLFQLNGKYRYRMLVPGNQGS